MVQQYENRFERKWFWKLVKGNAARSKEELQIGQLSQNETDKSHAYAVLSKKDEQKRDLALTYILTSVESC